jgi:hypothetical protein
MMGFGAMRQVLETLMRTSWLVLAALLLAGCATDLEPSSAELKARWEAENVLPPAYKSDLLAFLRTYLNNPSGIRNALVSQPRRKEVGPGDRYVACLRYTARNTEGKYQPPKDGVAVYVSGKLDRYFEGRAEVKALCTDASLEPFPELERLKR